jgi:small subunit ribosomal protein S20
MANHKSAKKAHENSVKNMLRNRDIKSRVKTFVKKVEVCIAAKEHANAMEALSNMESEMMSAVTKGVIKLNTAARKVSRMNAKIKAI